MAADRSLASRRASAVAVSLLTLAVVAGAVVLGTRRDAAPTSLTAPSRDATPAIAPPSPDAPPPTPLVSQPAMPPPLPKTTGRLAYSLDGDIYVAGTDGSDPLLVPDSTGDAEGCYEPRWSPDGRHLACTRNETFYVIDADGRAIMTGEGCCIGWSPDSVRIASVVGWWRGNSPRADAFTPEVEVIVTTIAGSEVARLGLPNPSASLGNIVRVHWTPDGRAVVISRVSGAPDGGRTWLVPVDGGVPVAFPVEPAYGATSIFSPDGSRVVGVVASRLVIAALDGTIIRRLDLTDEGIPAGPMWSPDGRLIAISVGNRFSVVDVATGSVRDLWSFTTSAQADVSYAGYVTGWSADSERVLVESYEPASIGLWSLAVDGSDRQRLVAGEVDSGSWQHLPTPES